MPTSDTPTGGTEGVAARAAAVDLISAVLQEGKLLSEVTGTLDRLPPEERARAQRLATETLRHLPNADRILAPFLQKRPKPRVMAILRLSTVELCTGGAAHGVVNAAVSMTGADRKTAGLKGLVNAVLRKVAASGPERWAELGSPRLPKWLRTPLRDAWGPDALRAMEGAHAETPPIDLTVRQDADDWAARLGGQVTPTGSVRLPAGQQVSALDGFADGAWWVQDAAAALPVRLLDPQPGEAIADLCAAPGGKTLQLAAAGATVTAVDTSAARLKRLRENLTRTGLTAEVVTADALSITGSYDAVLLDAPCSATGTIRRHPDLPYAKDGSGFFELIALQTRMLAHAATLVKPGGRLVFCTCSVLPDEGEAQIDTFLAAHPGWTLTPADLDGAVPDKDGALRLLPQPGGADGFYIARLQAPA